MSGAPRAPLPAGQAWWREAERAHGCAMLAPLHRSEHGRPRWRLSSGPSTSSSERARAPSRPRSPSSASPAHRRDRIAAAQCFAAMPGDVVGWTVLDIEKLRRLHLAEQELTAAQACVPFHLLGAPTQIPEPMARALIEDQQRALIMQTWADAYAATSGPMTHDEAHQLLAAFLEAVSRAATARNRESLMDWMTARGYSSFQRGFSIGIYSSDGNDCTSDVMVLTSFELSHLEVLEVSPQGPEGVDATIVVAEPFEDAGQILVGQPKGRYWTRSVDVRAQYWVTRVGDHWLVDGRSPPFAPLWINGSGKSEANTC